ncbi:MAG: VCBS repeat-containing protein [Flavobacteriales bacterium]|nr:VCBS repeat-containing protein [Flavobacteriales bacterium]
MKKLRRSSLIVLVLLLLKIEVFGQLFNGYSVLNSGSGPFSSTIADFNKDGKPDIATSNYNSASISVSFGNGDGTFGSPVSYSIAVQNLGEIKSADFNNDTYPDLVVGSYGSPTGTSNIYVLINNQSGGFLSPTNPLITLASGSLNPFTIDVGDMNNDNKMDIVSANYSGNNISLYEGNGNGTFNTAQRTKTHLNPFGVLMIDLNNDNKKDLVISCQGSAQFEFFKGNLSFNTFPKIITYNTGTNPGGIAAGDFNKDGKIDLCIRSNSNSGIYLHLGNGNDTFYYTKTISAVTSGYGIVLKDLNNDSNLDLATGNSGDSSVSVFLGNGDTTFQSRQNFGVRGGSEGLVSGDINKDGRMDLIASNLNLGSGNKISLLLNNGPQITYTILSSSGSHGSISPLGSTQVNQNGSQLYTFTPSSGYTVDSVIIDGTYIGYPPSWTFSNVTANHTIRITFKVSNYMLSFNGSDERVSLGTPLITGTGDFSISAWVYTPDAQKANDIAGNYNYPGGTSGVEFYIYQGKLFSYISSYLSGGSILSNTWYFVAMTRQSGLVRLYINGVEVASGNQAASIGNGFNFTLGNHPSTNIEQFLGYMDEVRIYSRALSVTELNQIYTDQGNLVNTSNFLVHLPMNEGSGLNAWNHYQNTPYGTITRTSQWAVSTTPNVNSSNGPGFELSMQNLEFDSVLLNFEYTRSVYIRNSGDDSLKVTNVILQDTCFSVSSDSFCIAPGDSFLLYLTFKPCGQGYKSTEAIFYHNGGSSPDTIHLSGYGEGGVISLQHLEQLCGCSLNSGSFFNGSVGCISGSGGRVYGTSNGGNTWTLINTGVNNILTGIRLIGNAAFITGSNGLICVSYNGGLNWTPFTTNTSETFYGLSFTNASYGFAVGGNGTICRYTSGNWYPYSLGTSVNFYGVYAYGRTAYAVGGNGTICRYIDGSWVPKNTGINADLYDVAFTDELYGFAVGQNGTICRTLNGGQNWIALNSGTLSNCRSIRIYSKLICFVVCEDGSLLSTYDGGNTWSRVFIGNYLIRSIEINGCSLIITSDEGYVFSFTIIGCDESANSFFTRKYCGTTNHLRSVSFSTSLSGCAAGYGGSVYTTVNGGNNWYYSNTGIPEHINCIRAVGNEWFISGENGLICRSTNGGSSWSPFFTGTTASFNSLSFVSSSRGWAVGSGGTICFYNGNGWTPQNVSNTITFYGVYAIGNTAYAVGTNGTVCKYVNGSWIPVNPGVNNTFYGVWFVSEKVGYIVGSGGIVCKTLNGGLTWTPLNCGTNKDLFCIRAACTSELLVGGDSGVVRKSSNSGSTWLNEDLGRNIRINEIEWSETAGYLVGNDGNVYSFSFGGNPDSIYITPDGPVELCHGSQVCLTANGCLEYVWSNSDTSRTICVNEEGTYQVSSGNGVCKDSASVEVEYLTSELVYNGNVVIQTQTEMNAFVSNSGSQSCGNKWNVINGDLTIYGNHSTDPVTNMSNLNRLTEVKGKLEIRQFIKNQNPVDLRDLESLKQVGNRLTIITNSRFEKIELPALTSVGGSIIIRGNANTKDIKLSKLKEVFGDNIHFSKNSNVERIVLSSDVAVFNWQNTGSNLDVFENGKSTASPLFLDLGKIRIIRRNFNFSDNSNIDVTQFDTIFSSLDSIYGNMTIQNNSYLEQCCMAASVVVGGNRYISGNTGNCSDLNAIINYCGPLAKRNEAYLNPNKDLLSKTAFIKIYPIPAANFLNVDLENRGTANYNVEITDIVGKTLFVKNGRFTEIENLAINLEEFEKGQYILKCKINDQVIIKRIMVR